MPWKAMPWKAMPWKAMPWKAMPWKAMPWKAMPWMQGSSTSPSTAFAETLLMILICCPVTHSYMRELKRF